MRELDVAPDGTWAVGRDTRGYIHDYKRPAADIYRVNTSTGERTLMLKGQLTGGHVFGISPHGTHFLYWKDNRFQAYDLDAGDERSRSATATRRASSTWSSIIPGPKPSYGIAGYTQRRQGGHRAAPLRPVADAARRLGAEEPDQRRGHEERDPLPLRADRAGRPRRGRRGGRRWPRAATIDLVEAAHALGLRRVHQEGRLLRAGERPAEGARLRGRRRSARR